MGNWWLGLEMLHTLFFNEHNTVAGALAQRYPTMAQDDEALFQVSRLIVSALMAKIHTLEWTPAVLQNPSLIEGLYINWQGLDLEKDLSLLSQVSNLHPSFLMLNRTSFSLNLLFSIGATNYRMESDRIYAIIPSFLG